MSAVDYRVRRATIDDLPQLIALWKENQLPELELERHFTDFQVIDCGDGRIAGALALQVSQKEGSLHSEVFTDFSMADRLRPLFWQRIQALALNHGLHRLWTRETSLYWRKEIGFTEAPAELAERLPASFGLGHGRWLTLQLREEHPLQQSAEEAFALFQEAERSRSEQVLQQARTLHWTASVLAVLVVILVGATVVYLLFFRDGLQQ